jgi:hypothetical protein
VSIGGGAATVQQYLAAGFAGRDHRLDRPRDAWKRRTAVQQPGEPKLRLEQIEAIDAPGVTHIGYARVQTRTAVRTN